MRLDIDVKGLKETLESLQKTARQVSGPGQKAAMRRATLIVARAAKRNAPVDTGRLRSSITPSVQSGRSTVEGVVGSNVKYAPFMELGTGRHWPPLEALQPWARRHGMTAFQVAFSIAKKGLKARKYLQNALYDNYGRIVAEFERMVKRETKK